MHFTRMGGFEVDGRPDHRPRRRLLPRGREREALPRRARGPLLGQHRLLVRRGDRPGRARADARAALLHELVVRASARDRARRRGGLARARRPEPRLLLLRRLGGRRIGLEARPAVLRGAWRAHGDAGARRSAEPRRPRRDRRSGATPPRSYKAIARHIAYHGTTLGALSINGIPAIRAPFEPLVPEVRHVSNTNRYHRPPDETEAEFTRFLLDELEQTILAMGPETVCLVHMEPVQNAGGCFTPPEGYWRGVREICDRYDILLSADEVITAFGRLGHWFGSERYDIRPGHRHVGQGPVVVVRRDRRGRRDRPRHGAVPRRRPRCSRTASRSAAIRSCARSR